MTQTQRNQDAVAIIREHFGLADTPISIVRSFDGHVYLTWIDDLGNHRWDVESVLWRSKNVW